MNIIKALNWRYAVRQFSDEVIDEHHLQELLNAARLSASSYGLQPYQLLVVQSADIRQKLLAHSMGQDKVAHCSHLLILAARTNIGDDIVSHYMQKLSTAREIPLADLQGFSDHIKRGFEIMSEQQKQDWAHQQAYIALGNLLTCAAIMHIDTCPMAGFEAESYDKVLGLAEKNLTTTVICPIGKRHPNDSTAYMQKVRLDHDEMVIRL